jgi:hypothetical protein
LLHQRKPSVYGRITEPTATDLPDRWHDHPAFKPE